MENPDPSSPWVKVFRNIFTSDLCRDLLEVGYVSRDGALPRAAGAELLAEAHALSERGGFAPHTFRFGASKEAGQAVIFQKPHIFEADLHDSRLRGHPAIPAFQSLFETCAVGRALAEHLPELGLSCEPGGITIKLQRNDGGGGCFPYHYDNPGPPNRRAITCLVYLNPSWAEGDGGELELQPLFAPPVRIPPTMGRIVLFRSDIVLHRVLPSRVVRFCFTCWVDGATNGQDDVNLKAKHLDLLDTSGPRAAALLLRASPLQRVLSRAVYAEEYETSLRECMSEPAGVCGPALVASRAVLAEHAAHVRALRSNPRLAAFIDALRDLRTSPEALA